MNHRAARSPAPENKKTLHYTQCGLDDIYLLSGYSLERTEYGGGVSIQNADQLHRAIGLNLASRRSALSGKEIRFLRKQMDLTQEELATLLGLSSQQVARWEKGQCKIPGPADRLVRGFFIEVSGGTLNLQKLARAIGESGPSVAEKSYFEKNGKGWKARMAA